MASNLSSVVAAVEAGVFVAYLYVMELLTGKGRVCPRRMNTLLIAMSRGQLTFCIKYSMGWR